MRQRAMDVNLTTGAPSKDRMHTPILHWNNEESKYVTDELADEFPSISATLIETVVRWTMDTVAPDDGRYKLLAAARRNLV